MDERSDCADCIVEMPGLRDHTRVFAERHDAGRVLAELMEEFRGADALVLGIAAGGVPVAAPLARALALKLDVAVVSKITLPWNPEAGFGAVAFDGTVRLNKALMERLPLSEEEVANGIEATREKVRLRVRELRGEGTVPPVQGRTAILVDDGLASGFTMMTAIDAVRGGNPARMIVAVPTASADAVRRIVDDVDCVYCCNIRSGLRFAVAEAYENWYEVPLHEVQQLLREHRQNEEG